MEVNRYSGVSGIAGKLVKCLSRNDVGSEMLFCGNQHVLGNMRTAFATFLTVSCTIRPSPHVDIPLPDGHRTICGEAKYEWCREEYSSKNRLKHGRLGSRAWYDRLKKFLLAQGFQTGSVDKTLFLLHHGNDLLVAHIYVDDIMFGASSHSLVSRFSE